MNREDPIFKYVNQNKQNTGAILENLNFNLAPR